MEDSVEPPDQGEPVVAGDDETAGGVVPVAATGGRRKTGARDAGGLGDETEPPLRRTAAIDTNPFGNEEETESPTSLKSSPRLKPARAAVPSKAIDDADIAIDSGSEAPPKRAKLSSPVKNRGPVLMLEAPGNDDSTAESDADEKGDVARPRLPGGSDNA